MTEKFPPAFGPGIPHREWSTNNLSWAAGSPHKEKILAEAGHIQAVIQRLTRASHALDKTGITSLKLEAEDVNEKDIQLLRQALQDGVPLTEANKGLYGHLDLAAEYGFQIAEASDGRLHPHVLEAAGLLNDVGKLTGIFRYHLNDLIGQEILEGMTIRPEIQDALMPAAFHIGPLDIDTYKTLQPGEREIIVHAHADAVEAALSEEQQAFILADIMGKRSKAEPDTLMTWDEMETYHMASRKSAEDYEALIGEKAIWPSEIYAYRHIAGWAEGWLGIYRNLKDKWKTRGVDMDEIRKRVQDSQ